jgi:hypothetical protein
MTGAQKCRVALEKDSIEEFAGPGIEVCVVGGSDNLRVRSTGPW